MIEDRLLSILPFLVLLLPFGGFLVLALFGDWIKRDREERGAGILACATVLAAFALTVWGGMHFRGLERAHVASVRAHEERLRTLGIGVEQQEDALRALRRPLFLQPHFRVGETGTVDWIAVGDLQVPVALLVDRLTLLMMLVVTGVGSLIHVYSLGYMAHDPDRVRYFSYLNLFTFFMLLLVMAASLPLMFVGWEGVGLCSYLLIGFWFKRRSAADAGKKAFIVNRVGDAGLILGMIVLYHGFGSLDFATLIDRAANLTPEGPGRVGALTAACLLLFVGAAGKSAQVPLHVWLPDAMEGPTPVSALIHAATMVTAGVYLVARLGPLFVLAPTALLVVGVVGAVTALMAATVALVQTDIKRVLAYSTVSQLGFMFVACGVAAFGVAIFHLFTHAFFKALLFLGAGSVIHALSGEQDMRKMGGLRRAVPWTFGTFAVGALAIAGLPGLSGFFSKDQILAAALSAGRRGLFAVALLTAALTAFYMARLVILTFLGRFRGGQASEGRETHAGEAHAHESPAVMLLPLVLLAAGSIGAGYLHVPQFLEPVFRGAAARVHHVGWLPLAAVAAFVVGTAAAVYLYLVYEDLPARIAARARALRRVLEAKYGFDLAFDWLASSVIYQGSGRLLWRAMDARVIDGAGNGAGTLVDAMSRSMRRAQSGLVRGYALLILGGAVAVVGYLLWAS